VSLCSCELKSRPADAVPPDISAQETPSIADPAPERIPQGFADELDYIYSSPPMATFFEKVRRAEAEMFEESKELGEMPIFHTLDQPTRLNQLLRIMRYARHGGSPADRLHPGDRELLRERLPSGLKWLDHMQTKPLTQGIWVDPLLLQYEAESTLAFHARQILEWSIHNSENAVILAEALESSFQAKLLADRVRDMDQIEDQEAAKQELRSLLRDCLNKMLEFRTIDIQRTQSDIAAVRELLNKAAADDDPALNFERREAQIVEMEKGLAFEMMRYDLLKANFDLAVEQGMTRLIYGDLFDTPFDL
jgi:hypothetical protein